MFVTTTARLTHAGAKHMMATAHAAGIAVSVAICDAGEHLLLLERMDGGRCHTVHSATTKAVCAVSGGDWQTDARIAVAAVESIGAAT
jgi:uncharacterized protein GlcG (DUF336 family)